MLRETELTISEDDSFFRTPEGIKLAQAFNSDHGQEFSDLIGNAVDVLARNRPSDPMLSFVRAFRPKLPVGPIVSPDADPLEFPPLEPVLSDVQVIPTVDSVGNIGIRTQIIRDNSQIAFCFDTIFDETTTDIQNNHQTASSFKHRIREAAQNFAREWMRDWRFKYGKPILKNYLNIEQSLSTFFDAKTEIPEPTPTAPDTSGKNTKKQHLPAKAPLPTQKKPVERIKYNALEDGFVGVYLVSFALLGFLSQQLRVPLRRLIRLVANLILPEAQWPITIPLPFLRLFATPRQHTGKVKILQEVLVVPQCNWNPSEFFDRVYAVHTNFKRKMAENQQVNLYKCGSFYWNLEKISDVFGPIRSLMEEVNLEAALSVTLKTTDLEETKSLYDIKGKPKGVESVIKILSVLIRRDRTLIVIFNPVNVEHREKLKPLCERWAERQRKLIFFHDKFQEFHETLQKFPPQFRGALISIRPEENLRNLIKRVADAHGKLQSLGIPVCLQNISGLQFADPTVLVEVAVGLGIEFVKIDSPGRPELFQVADFYQQLSDHYRGRTCKPLQSPEMVDDNHAMPKLEKLFSEI
ncbi:uncharacterized protein LOC129598023 isoform X2 [Paramacrobiotus metropolitanus]|uniref:uncharacterized protein LOC129598023 isoform X2 n=1 Tax=Paramacrobiotus metropolitanus TaxID=2943436 RepID=UPI002445C3FE|nr:uncharacterized protein LOC129598023 isoform X2 [Paramacrobiotus metropolitanus]